MKIYTKIILDKNNKLISEEFFDYNGKIAFAIYIMITKVQDQQN